MKLEASDISELRPVINEVVSQVLDQHDAQHGRFGNRLAFSEAEAAELLGVKRTVLRDCRLRGEIKARKVGKEYRYTRDELLEFLKREA